MSQPEGFIDPDHPEYVCKLKACIGLKQSARCWTLNSFLMANGSDLDYKAGLPTVPY